MTTVQLALGLLAFTIALYTLTGREQRSPYLTSAAFGTSLAVLAGGLFAFLASAIPDDWQYPKYEVAAIYSKFFLEFFAQALLAAGLVKVALATVHLRNRRVNFRDDYLLASNYKFFRWAKYWWHRFRRKNPYQHNAEPWPAPVLEYMRNAGNELRIAVDRLECKASLEPARSPTVTVAAVCDSIHEGDALLIPLAEAFLKANCLVQYMTSSRHPVQFVAGLRKNLGDKFEQQGGPKRLTVIDAYTPHFGFTDSVHDRMRERFAEWNIDIIISGPSYAGMHTASAKAFNKGKKKSAKETRTPTLVIYEGSHALTDLESEEQYRVFLRHVLPSEQLWGGMFTLFVEFGLPPADKAVLRTYADGYIEKAAPKEA